MLGAILVTLCVIGGIKARQRDINSEWQLICHILAAALFSRGNMQDAAVIVGRNYELVSILTACLVQR